MKFHIDGRILQDYPLAYIGVVVVRDADNVGENNDITNLLRSTEQETKGRYSGINIPEHPHIKPWREAYEKFGSKPRDFRCSSEALLRMVLNGRELRHINKFVDLYNCISLKYTLTLGGEDLDKMRGDLILEYAEGTESFTALGSTENEPPLKGEVVYRDDLGVVCRRWNWRESDRTKLEETTKNAVLVLEGIPPIQNSTIEQASKELEVLVKKYCGGSTKVIFLNAENKSADL